MMKKDYLITLLFTMSLFALTAQSPHFFGATYSGGDNEEGSIFRTDIDGTNYSLAHSFDIIKDGASGNNQKLLEVGGKFFGTTSSGGNNDMGVLFEFNPTTGVYSVKHHFDQATTGAGPYGTLLLSSNGKIYGTTLQGGSNSYGTMFEYNITTSSLTKKYDFDSTASYPIGQMVETSPGIIFGISYQGGAVNYGTVYQYTISTNTLVVKDEFDAIKGGLCVSGLMQANNGILYGLALGGVNTKGTLFQFSLTEDSIRKLHDFDGLDAKNPSYLLTQGANGKLYGGSKQGGVAGTSNGFGTLFDYDINLDSVTILKQLRYSLSDTGYYPQSAMIETSPGKFLLSMEESGINGAGGVHEFDVATRTLTLKSYYDYYRTGYQTSGVIVKHATSGKYYLLSDYGGAGDAGTIMEYDYLLDTLKAVKHFSPAPGGINVGGKLLEASNGKLYGITSEGGLYAGVIFEVDPNTHTVIKKADFDGLNGLNPQGALVEVGGKIYGTTPNGGLNNNGVIYSYDLATSALAKVKDFDEINGGSNFGGLMKASNGKLYGTTYRGGAFNFGILFEYDLILDTLISKFEFNGTSTGRDPEAVPLEASNGKLYGTTFQGGSNFVGILYEYDLTTDSATAIVDFSVTNGAGFKGPMIESSTGKIYGVTARGGMPSVDDGVVYEYDILTKTIIVRAYFDENTVGRGGRELMEASNGRFFGTSSINYGNPNNGASLYEFIPSADTLISRSVLSGYAGIGLIELVSNNSASILESEVFRDLSIYPNPTKSILNIDTEGEKIVSVRVFAISGQLVESELNTNNTLDVSNYKNGMYILQVETQKGTAISRFIKQ